MGNVLGFLITMISLAALSHALRSPDTQHITPDDTQARHSAEEAPRQAERMSAHMEEEAANGTRGRGEAAANMVRGEAAKLTQEAQEEHKRLPRRREERDRTISSMREEAGTWRAQQAVDEQHRGVQASEAPVEKLPRVAPKEAQKALEAKAEAEGCLKGEIQHVAPVSEGLVTTRRRMTRENTGKEIVAMNQEAERIHQVADNQHREAEAGKALIDPKLPRIASKETQKAVRGQGGGRKVPERGDPARS